MSEILQKPTSTVQALKKIDEVLKSDKFGHTYCPERRVGLHGVRQVMLQNHPKNIQSPTTREGI